MSHRIALLAGWYYPTTVGGTEAYVQALAQDLGAVGYEVCVVAPSVDEEEYYYEYNGITVFRYPIEKNPSIHDLHIGKPPRYLENFNLWLEKWRPDLVHFHSVNRNIGVHHARAIKAKGISIVLTAHVVGLICQRGTLKRWGSTPCDGVFSKYRCSACCMQNRGLPKPLAWPVSVLSSTSLLEGVPGRIGRMLHYTNRVQETFNSTMRFIDLADYIVVVSEGLKEVLELNGVDQRKIVFSRHGLPAHYLTGYPTGQRSDTTVRIGYLGRFAPSKGVHVLVEAFQQVPRDISIELHLWGTAMPGDVAYLNEIKQQVKADPRIHYRGPLTDEHRHDVLGSWHGMAVPSLVWETGPLVVLEAFAAGIPVLGSKLGGIAEQTEHQKRGLLIPPGDVAAWKQALVDFYQLTLSKHTWQFSAVRPSREVAIDMSRLYTEAM